MIREALLNQKKNAEILEEVYRLKDSWGCIAAYCNSDDKTIMEMDLIIDKIEELVCSIEN